MKIPNKIRIISIDYAIENPKYLDTGLELGENEEKIIDALAYGINQVIQDNKEKLFGTTENNKVNEDK